ncbi:MAG: aldo/keto reductase [Erysipelotrichaceae bacterium]|nr:aldo/keto reductase [Erysipelotrichaceae bacterium]
MEYITLNNGNRMPMDGIGVFLLKPEEAEASVLSALNDGIRLIDTANAYMNEKAVGRAIKRSGINREEIFLVTKLWPTVYEDENAIEETLKRLDTDFIDLLFLHQPAGNWRKGYELMEKAYKEGKVKALGLSNFPEEYLREIIDTAEVKPQMVQVEAHPYYPQTELKKLLSETGMGLMAWYPLGHGDKSLINEEVFTRLSKKYNKTNAQIILRWHIQSGNVIFPGSKNPAHIRDNFNIFDFKLTDEEMEEIKAVDKNVRYYNATVEEAQRYAHMELDFNSQP